MSYRLRKLVFWLLLIALPLQGFAAATGAACTCLHAQMTSDAPQHGDHAMHGDGAEDGGTPCHAPPVQDAQHCAAHGDDGASGMADPSGTACKACAGCCIAHAALPAVVITPQEAQLPRTQAGLLPDPFTDYVAPTPKRPPRPLPA